MATISDILPINEAIRVDSTQRTLIKNTMVREHIGLGAGAGAGGMGLVW